MPAVRAWCAATRACSSRPAYGRYGRYRLDTEDGAITDLDAGAFHIGATMSADGSVTATIGAPDGGLAEVFVHDAGGTRALTDFGAQLGGMARPRQTLMQWSSFDDLEIEGVLTWPADYEPGRAYPLFVRTHGGPTGTDRPGLCSRHEASTTGSARSSRRAPLSCKRTIGSAATAMRSRKPTAPITSARPKTSSRRRSWSVKAR